VKPAAGRQADCLKTTASMRSAFPGTLPSGAPVTFSAVRSSRPQLAGAPVEPRVGIDKFKATAGRLQQGLPAFLFLQITKQRRGQTLGEALRRSWRHFRSACFRRLFRALRDRRNEEAALLHVKHG